jgi:hypothetical protein
MDDVFFHLLSVMGEEPQTSLEIAVAAGMKDSGETVSRLMTLKKVRFVDESNGHYTITIRGTKALEADRMTRGGMLLTTPILTDERKAASEPKQEPRIATLLTPALSVWVDRWGNPCVRPAKKEPWKEPEPNVVLKPRWHDRT